MVTDAEPPDFERFGVVVVVGMDAPLRSADLAGLPNDQPLAHRRIKLGADAGDLGSMNFGARDAPLPATLDRGE